MRKFGDLVRRAFEILKEEGLIVLVRRVRIVLFYRMQYWKRWRKRRKVKKYKQNVDKQEDKYNHDPKVSFAIQSFNRSENIRHLATHIPQSQEYETIVLEDGSIDGSLKKWDGHLTRRNDFLIRSNDLHEIRTYTRAAQFMRGDYLCLLQDDDTLPEQSQWIEWVLEFFESFPDLAVVGGFAPVGLGEKNFFDSRHNRLSHDDSIPPISEWAYSSNEEKFPLVNNEPLPIIDPNTERPFIFVPIVSVGPYVIDLDVYERLNGFDLDFSEPGKPGILFDGEFSLRCWKNGYRVGYTNMGNYAKNIGGTELFANDDRQRQAERNIELIEKKHGSEFDIVEKKVCTANADLVRVENPSEIQGLNLTYQ